MLRAVAAASAASVGAISEGEKGQPNGVATLDANSKVPVAQLPVTLTGEANKIPQMDSGQVLNINTATFGAAYGADSIFIAGAGQWVNMDFSSQEIDFIKTGEDTVSIGLSGVEAGSKPITTSHVPSAADDVINKAYLDARLPAIVASDSKSAQTANVNAPTVYAVPASGTYRVSTFIVVTTAATTSSTMPSVSVNYTEASSGVAVQDLITNTATNNQVGLHSGGTAIIAAQQGSNIGYVTSGYASAGATAMAYRVDLLIERLS